MQPPIIAQQQLLLQYTEKTKFQTPKEQFKEDFRCVTKPRFSFQKIFLLSGLETETDFVLTSPAYKSLQM
jgi:hypothetical protein